jgi:hypothetical protein
LRILTPSAKVLGDFHFVRLANDGTCQTDFWPKHKSGTNGHHRVAGDYSLHFLGKQEFQDLFDARRPRFFVVFCALCFEILEVFALLPTFS